MAICYLGVGSNLGDKKNNIRRAIESINARQGMRVLAVSPLIRTRPVGGPLGQPDYLNGCLKISTTLSPLRLLHALKKIERALGRRRGVRFGPRVIDLDILLYGNMKIKRPGLRIPHPRMFERDFVVRPLLTIL
ncbi:MAG: 2-amino-4-hydroxy-6-hydroxymethyldihydropteridine diphosphokinase [Candidatus Omnitrophica bacterium]|nr:2-amino-4-hydroxy-6-hydroxymethyldihydropteridine diphosphokinase [Candidatus Omnitrophota bacterium]